MVAAAPARGAQRTDAAAEPGAGWQAAATALAAERRRVFLAGAAISVLGPALPYLTGTWESVWFGLAASNWPLPLRTVIFLAGFHLALAVLLLPLSYYGGFTLPHAFGLSHQTRRAWWADWAKATGLGALFGTLLGGLFVVCVQWLGPPAWAVAFAAALSLLAVVLTFLAPYVLVPLFFTMRPVADQRTVERIRALLARAGTDVREICALDFSRRTAEANAAVIGLGRSRRVVLADTLLADFPPDEVEAVVAHELGHHVCRDVLRLLAGELALVWLGLLLAALAAPMALPVLSLPSLGYVPGYPQLYAVAGLAGLLASPLTRWWSRRIERSADRYALALTERPGAFAAALRRLARQNLVELEPPRWAEVLLASHPPMGRRIALAEGFNSQLAGGR